MLNKILLLFLVQFLITHTTLANDDKKDIPDLRVKSSDRHMIDQSMENTKKLIERKKDGTEIENLSGKRDHINQRTHGVPHMTEQANAEKLILRQFVSSWANEGEKSPLDKILESRRLRVGPVPYAEVSRMYRNMYPDLLGVFFTLPNIAPREVGVNNTSFVDFEIFPGTGVLKMQDKIYLIPGEKGFEVPIKILAYGKVDDKGNVVEKSIVARTRITQLPKATAKRITVIAPPPSACNRYTRYLR